MTSPVPASSRTTPPRHARESSTSRVRLHLKPGQKGTKQLLTQYGDRLMCVRYRHDAQRKKRFKTVEIIVAERDWQPPRPRTPCRRPDRRATGRVRRRDGAQPGEAGGWNVESRPTGLAFTLRSCSRTRPDQPHPRRTGIQYRTLGVRREEFRCRYRGAIHIEMLASIAGCQHPVTGDSLAVQ